jgi:urease accessory protein
VLTVTATITSIMTGRIIMSDQHCRLLQLSLLRQQSWLSPAFPTGSYSYSHGIEWAVEAGHIHDRKSLVDWLEADLCYGSGRNEAIFLIEAWRSAREEDCGKLLEIAGLAAAFRGTSEFALETSQQAASCLATLRRVWPDPLLETLSELLSELRISPVLSVVLGVRAAKQGIPATLALPAFLQSYLANLITAGIRLVPLGQTDGQLAIAELEPAVLAVAAQAQQATIHDLGSVGFMVDLASALHETQYTRLFRS